MKSQPATPLSEIKTPKEGDLRVWWIPQVPMKPFRQDVSSVAEGKLLVDTLAKYDIFQLENRIKPEYCNAGGLEVFTDGDWSEWEDADGNGIDDTEIK
jgi:hypothetical protein